MNSHQCPLVTPDNTLITHYLTGLSLHDLITLTEQLFCKLTAGEQVTYDINRYCSEYSDRDGRVAFFRALIENHVIYPLHIPLSTLRDPQLANLIRSPVYEYYTPIAQEQNDDTALTDDIEVAPPVKISVSSPRWEHVDEGRRGESPSAGTVGDTVALMVDVAGYPDGAPVVFDVFDASGDPAFRIETVRGINEHGTARVEWVVTDPNERGDGLRLSFEGSARSKSSGQAPIDLQPLTKRYEVKVLDDDGMPREGVKVCFTVDGSDFIVPTDENGCAVQPAVGGFKGAADVTIIWDDETSVGNGPGSVAGIEDIDPEPGVIEICVTDENNQPVEGAEVTFTVDGEDNVVLSDRRGHARFEHPDAEEALVSVKLPLEEATAPEVQDTSPHSDIRARALTDEQVREALQYHIDQGDITLTVAAVPEDGGRVSLSENSIAGVMVMQLVDPFVRGTAAESAPPGAKHEKDKFSCKALTAYHRSLLNQRHALALVRLCKNILAPKGFKTFYTQGLNGDTSRKDCHGWGTALDFGGASTELPPEGTTHSVRLGVDFIVYLHWGLIPMWDPATVAESSNPAEWKRQLPWKLDDGTDFTKNPSGKKLHYRLDPPPYQDAENGKEPSADIKDHFRKASKFFKDIYQFAVEEYSDATSELGPGVADSPTTEIDSHSGHFVLHPDYPKPNEAGSKYGRNAHNNHLHMQLGKTNYDSVA